MNRIVSPALAIMLLALPAGQASAEEIMVKGMGRSLGWLVAGAEGTLGFRDCSGRRFAIGDGRVAPAKRHCPKRPPDITAEGVVAAYDPKALLLTIETGDGKRQGFYLSGSAIDGAHLGALPDEREIWVSAELSGRVDVIDAKTLQVIDQIPFLPRGFRKEQVTPVDVLITKDGTAAYVALGRANHVAVVDVARREVEDYILVGSRAWVLTLTRDESKLYVANGLSDDITIIDTATRKVIKSVPVGLVPYGILIDD